MSSRRRLFREEAFARRGRTEPLDGPLRVTAPHEWAILLGLALALFGLGAWGLFGNIDRTLAAECLLVRPGERYTVISGASGVVINIAVSTGDLVETGQPLAYVRIPELGRHVAMARARVAALESTIHTSPDVLALARSELVELEALQASGEAVVSPYAGEVTAHNLVRGQAVEVGAEVARIRGGATGTLDVVAFVAPASAERLGVGMDAQVLPQVSNRRDSQALAAEVQDISSHPVTPPGWLTAFGLEVPERGHLLRLSLTAQSLATVADGTPCNLRVVLRKDPPVRLITT